MNATERIQENDYEALLDELTKRYGCGAASEIVEQIKLAESTDKTPDYVPVKASADMLWMFRGEARFHLQQLKQIRAKGPEHTSNVTNFEKRRLEKEFRHIYRLYWVSMKLFHPLYNKAEAAYQPKPYKATKMSQAA